jgi:hypothetical protein
MNCLGTSDLIPDRFLEVDQHDRVAKDRRFEIDNGEVFTDILRILSLLWG